MVVAKLDARVTAVGFEPRILVLTLVDGRELRVPLSWFPRLERATRSQLVNHRIIEDGRAVHWPELDEDIGIEPLLATSA